MKIHTYRFSKDLSCRVTVSDTAPKPGKNHIHRVEWTGKPTRKVVRRYIRWMNQLNQDYADRWGVTVSYVCQVTKAPSGWQCFVYEPGGSPTRVETPLSLLRAL